MKIVDGKCPYCSSPVTDKPGKVKRDIKCSTCDRFLTLQPDKIIKNSIDEDGFKTLEPGIVISFLVSLTVAFNSSFLTMIAVALGAMLMVFLTTNEEMPGLPDDLQARFMGSAARLKVFPFEMYLVGFWVFVLILQIANAGFLKGFVVSVMMALSAIMALQANRLYLDNKIKTSDLSLADFPMFLNILIDPQTAFEKKRYDGVADDSKEGEELFSKAAAKKQEIDQKLEHAQNDNELQEKKDLCALERKSWEDDMLNRYNTWLDEESSRLLEGKR